MITRRFFTWVLLLSLVLASCSTVDVSADLKAANTAIQQEKMANLATAEALRTTQTAISGQSTLAALQATQTELAIMVAREIQLTSTPTVPGQDYPQSHSTPLPGQEIIDYQNFSGQDVKLTLTCVGGPCKGKNPSSYTFTFPQGISEFAIWPGRYKMTETVCGKTYTDEGPLNGSWYFRPRKCK